MKKSLCGFLLLGFLLTALSPNLQAQDSETPYRVSLYGGASIPMGDFSKTGVNKSDGFANTGFCAMLEGRMTLSESFLWVSSITMSINGMAEGDLQNRSFGYKVSADSYNQFWFLTGFSFDLINRSKSKLIGILQIGTLVPSFPDITYSSNNIISGTQSATGSLTLAYGFALEMLLKDISISVKYSAASPEFEITNKWTNYSYKNTFTLPQNNIQIMLGVNL